MTFSFSEICDSLRTKGYVVNENFLNQTEVQELRDDAFRRHRHSEFHRAGIGRGPENKRLNSDVRRDEICWFDESSLSEPQQKLFQRLSILKDKINESLLLGLWDFEMHYALYEPGGFYRRHLDRFRNESSRTVSLVIYLNQDWKAEDGGQLVIYQNPGAGEPALTVTPLAGTLVCFMSDEIEHEVLPANRQRLSIATWFRTRGPTLA